MINLKILVSIDGIRQSQQFKEELEKRIEGYLMHLANEHHVVIVMFSASLITCQLGNLIIAFC